MKTLYIKLGILGVQIILFVMQLAFGYDFLVIPIVLMTLVNVMIK